MQNKIFSIDEAKAAKSQAFGWLDAIHYMAPFDLAGVGNLCPHSTPGCRSLCLGEFSGQAALAKPGEVSAVGKSRREKAVRFMTDRTAYLQDVARSIGLAVKTANNRGLKPCVRLNGSTDIAWEGIQVVLTVQSARLISKAIGRDVQPATYRNLMDLFPEVQFMDYTKSAKRCQRKLPANYHLTLSRSEMNEQEALEHARNGGVVAVVFDKVPNTWHGLPVINGDKHDLRFLDAPGSIVGLEPKGNKAKRDQSGFVVRLAEGGANG